MTPEATLVYAYKVAHVPPDWRDDVVQDAMMLVCLKHLVHGVVQWDTCEEEVVSLMKRATYQRQHQRERTPVVSLDAILSGELTMHNLARWLGKGD